MTHSFRFLLIVTVAAQALRWTVAQVVGPSWTASPFHPHAIPLAVRSPYLNCWAAGGNGSQPISNQWPTLWDMSGILGWAVFVRVDGIAYSILGQPPLTHGAQLANQTGFSFSATQSKFVHTAGNVMVTTNFISPIEPTNLVLQSLPATYLTISTQSTDGRQHRIQVYSDISAEWISGDDTLTAEWNTNTTSSSVIHSVHLGITQPFAVLKNHIQDATAYYGTMNGGAVTWQTSAGVISRSQFTGSGQLTNTSDTNFRPVSQNFPVFALSTDLGMVANSNGPVVFALGLIRDPAIQSLSDTGQPESRSLYFWTEFSTAIDAMAQFISDFSRAASAANSFDSNIRNAAMAVSSDYADLVDLSTRQVYGMIEITVGKDANGNWNTSDIQAFMNDAGGGVSTVDIMFPAFPLFLQTNPVIAGALLKPLLQWQQGNGYPNPFAAHDLGTLYPNAVGDPMDNTVMPVEESANMLIMTLAQARASGDGTLVSNYYNVLDKWAQYLVSNAMNPGDQDFTDSFLTGSVVNDTNLALKGILGIQAMAGIASAMNNTDAATNYSSIASTLLNQWQSLAFSQDGSHLVLGFGNISSSLSLPYNLYADKLLGLNLIPQTVYDKAAAFLKTQTQTYGVALDSRSANASKTDWALFTAAALTDTDARNTLISSVRKYAANQLAHVPFSDFYDVSQGTRISFQARPVQGAMYSILALQASTKPIVIPPPSPSTTSPSLPSPSLGLSPSASPRNAAARTQVVSHNLFMMLTIALGITAGAL
ncbi:hypothetical protein JB92DRAFT_3121204 [Gautieria morchelliformis]|nr:hypothetical protein JB92DRAFT_3121204 [Gautieria morchelliformis]